jgi:predicted nucleic acid-binding protein
MTTTALIDTSVLIHLYRKHPAALAWFSARTESLALCTITWLEFIEGAPNKTALALCLTIVAQFEMIHLTAADQDWAMVQMQTHRLSKGLHQNDCLIASVCHRLQVPIYTHNVKDLVKVLPASKVIRPFIA